MKLKWSRHPSIQRLFIALVLALSLVFFSFSYNRFLTSIHFVDEEDNLVLGQYLTQGEKLYSDLFSHHQPLAYILSAGVQKITKPNSIYLLIAKHRQFIIAWSLMWGIWLTWRFGMVGWLTAVGVESSKLVLFGNLFLAESLVVYPLIYLVGILFEEKQLNRWEMVFVGLVWGFCLMLLSPIWLLLGVILVRFWFKFRLRSWWFILGVIPVVILCSWFISWPSYIYNAFYINFAYYIPITTQGGFFNNLVLALITPLNSFQNVLSSQSIWLIRALSVGLIAIVFRVFLKDWKEAILILVILGLANSRNVRPGMDYYSGFHLLPWLGLMFWLNFSLIGKFYLSDRTNLKIVGLSLITLIMVAELGLIKSSLTVYQNIQDNLYINYSQQFSMGEAVRIMKVPSERLFVAPDEWLVYWQGQIPHASKMVNFYAWMWQAPPLADKVTKMFTSNPPDYIYLNMPGTGFEKYTQGYQVVIKDGQPTRLYVKKGKIESLTISQRNGLRYLNFQVDGS